MVFNFSWIIPDRVGGMGRPGPDAGVWLKDQGVTAVLSLTVAPPGDFEEFDTLHIPVRDMTSPTLDQLHEGVEYMRTIVASGGAVVTHCLGGMGRTGTFLAGYLVGEGMGASEAIERLRAIRPGSIETVEQEETVHRYADLVGGKKG